MKTIEKVNPILDKDVTEWSEIHKKISVYEEKIFNRIDYIIKRIYSLYGHHVEWWDFPGHGEQGDGGVLSDSLKTHNDYIRYQASIEYSGPSENVVAILKEGEWGFEDSFPKRWLFEDFENELIEGKSKFEEKEKLRILQLKEKHAKKKQNKILKSIEDNKAMEELKKKLSKEELEILKRNL